MMKYLLALLALAAMPLGAQAQTYPPLSAYMMTRDAEIALARTAAPGTISGTATIKVLTQSGYEIVSQGTDGFTCIVMRGFSAPTFTPAPFRNLVYDPTVRAPICFNEPATKMVLPYYELRAKLAMQGKSPDQIAHDVQAAYANGTLPKRTEVSLAYMWSSEQNLASGIGHWHPHLMIFAPNYTNAMVGNNKFGSPLPQLSDDAGTPFSVIVVPVDMNLFQKGP
jgi:hypothetical protein